MGSREKRRGEREREASSGEGVEVEAPVQPQREQAPREQEQRWRGGSGVGFFCRGHGGSDLGTMGDGRRWRGMFLLGQRRGQESGKRRMR